MARTHGDQWIPWPTEDGPWEVRFAFSGLGDRMEVTGFEMRPHDPQHPHALTAAQVDRLRFGEMSERARRRAFRDGAMLATFDNDEAQLLAARRFVRKNDGRKGRPALSHTFLQEVAEFYSEAAARVRDPVNQVAAQFGVARSTAAGWVRRARIAGVLGPTEERKAGGAAVKEERDA